MSSESSLSSKATCLCGDHSTVCVEPRTWPGINKHGGIGRITKHNEDGTFNIKYLLGGNERNVDRCYIVCNIEGNEKRAPKERESFVPEVTVPSSRRQPGPQTTTVHSTSGSNNQKRTLANHPPGQGKKKVVKHASKPQDENKIPPSINKQLCPPPSASSPIKVQDDATDTEEEEEEEVVEVIEEESSSQEPENLRLEAFKGGLSHAFTYSRQSEEISLEDLYEVVLQEGFTKEEVSAHLKTLEDDNHVLVQGTTIYLI